MSNQISKSILCLMCSILLLVKLNHAAMPVSQNASIEACALLNYIYDMYGENILSGQMYAPWASTDETEYVYQITGKYPALRGQDLINEGANNNEIQDAINWWRAGGIPTIMWHWGCPTVGEGYNASKNNDKPLAAGYVDKCLTPGTIENTEMMKDLDRIAGHLLKLKNAKIPIIWRPMHECSGGWFWWDKNGPDGFKKLWRFMFDYFTKTKGLNNLLWFLGYDGSPENAYNPGVGYYDLVGSDTYGDNSAHEGMFNACKSIHGSTIPIAYHECGTPPLVDLCKSKNAMWAWFMVWHTGHIFNVDQTHLKAVYSHNLVITRDEIPDIVKIYGGDSSANPIDSTPSSIESYVKISDGEWQENDSVFVDENDSLVFGPHPYDTEGTWSWSGPNGLSDATRELKITSIKANQAGKYIVTYTNENEIKSSCTLTVTVQPSVAVKNSISYSRTFARFENNTIKIDGNLMRNNYRINIFNLKGELIYKKNLYGAFNLPLRSIVSNGCYIITVSHYGKLILHKNAIVADMN